MKSPWTRKNPLLSMYLSGANAVAGAARGRAAAAMRRQAKAMVTGGVRQMIDFWSDVLVGPPPRRRRRKPR